jgi:hypothetical protein
MILDFFLTVHDVILRHVIVDHNQQLVAQVIEIALGGMFR